MPSHRIARAMFLIALAAGSGIFLAAAHAQAPAAPLVNPNPTANAVALAREIITLKGGNQMFDSIVPGVIESGKNTFIPTNPNLNKELNEVTAQLRTEFEPKKAEVLNEVARTYARRFTEQELKELVAFYKTALGKKLLLEEPQAVEDGLKRAQDWANAFSDTVLNRIRAEMKKKGFDL